MANQLHPAVNYLGSGNYHYITQALLSFIGQPFTLVLFDHHTDALANPAENILSCGSWVTTSLEKITNLQKVIMIGVDPALSVHFPMEERAKIKIFKESSTVGDPFFLKELSLCCGNEAVYISIDKDVLSKSEVSTNWDQGTMRMAELLRILNWLKKNHEVVGADICGEENPGFFIHDPYSSAVKRRNNHANLMILQQLLN